MPVEAPVIDEARRVIANYPRTVPSVLHLEAVKEIIMAKTHLDIEVPQPSPAEISVILRAANNDIYPNLVYLPGV